jgi:nucleoside-diphosphate-sugar epimerase
MHVLVTGAAGMVGRATLDLLAQEDVQVTALVLEPTPDELPAARTVVGDATDVDVVVDALRGVDAVIHLAAIPTPDMDTAERVFGRNTLATFVVLEQAGRAGVGRATIASSYSVCGLPFATRPLTMPYLPIDRRLPLQITDPYALSKRADEATAEMAALRHGMRVVALRYPFIGTPEGRLPTRAAMLAEDPAQGAAEVWSYLDARDAARAAWLSLTAAGQGADVVYVAAPLTLAPYPTEWLLDRFHPGVPRTARHPGRAVPIELEHARELIGFTARHLWPIDDRNPPEDP